MWVSIKKILPFSLNKIGLGSILEFNELSLNWDKVLGDFIGSEFRNKTRPISLKGKVLLVDCLNSIWAAELQLKQEIIIKQINQIFNKEIIKEIRFIS